MRILLIEDEARLNEALIYILKKNNYLADGVLDGLEGLDMALSGVYDVIILDRMLPGMEGVEILHTLRAENIQTPVIFLTARDSVDSRIEGLDAGADDYLIKPFSKDELLARIRALGRRPAAAIPNGVLTLGRLSLDREKCAAYADGKEIKLTNTESGLLELLMRNKGQALRREQILDRVWGLNSDADINAVELYVHYLRKKIDFHACGTQLQTVRGVGYMLKEARNG